MIYISISRNMSFKKITDEEKGTRDCFVSKDGTIIELQSKVKEALRGNTGHKRCIKLDDFTIYLRKPPFNDEDFWEYSPNCNGKYPTEIEPKLIKGFKVQKFDPKKYTEYGSFWYQKTQLSSERKEEIYQHRLQQKENRRHYGDSPFAT